MMEDPIIPVSVKAMTGRFEKITTDHPKKWRPYHRSQSRNNVSKSQKNHLYLNKNPDHVENIKNKQFFDDKHPFLNGDLLDKEFNDKPNYRNENELSDDDIDGTYYCKDKLDHWSKYDNRSRSHSVGSLLSRDRDETDNYRDNDLLISRNSNLNSFTDKQKLVQSIVMNIKQSSCKETKNVTGNKSKSTNPPITSKLEKDLRNALEKGVRKLSVRKRSRSRDKRDEVPVPIDKSTISYPIMMDNNKNSSKLFTGKLFNTGTQKQSGLSRKSNSISSPRTSPTSSETLSSLPMLNNTEPPTSLGSYTPVVPVISADHSNSVVPVPAYDGTHGYRSAHTILGEPVRPPRRKSPKKLTNDISESILIGNKKSQINHYYSSIPDLRFKSHGNLQEGEVPPPKKPPRTFAHDIYMNTKQEQRQLQSRFLQNGSGIEQLGLDDRITSLNRDEIDALYAKPVKRNKSKQTEQQQEFLTYSKPEIAPKPSLLVDSEARNRYSIVETPSNSKEFSEAKKAAVKRNSSFRFSFRKPTKSSTYLGFRQPQPNSPKKIHRLSNFANNFQRKKPDGCKKVTFSQRSKSDELLYSEDRIYAIPHEDRKSLGNEPELHYMCSPLFTDYEDDWSTDNEEPMGSTPANLDKDSPARNKAGTFRAKFGLGGLKQEWRQSCRFVQKKIKSLSPTEKKM